MVISVSRSHRSKALTSATSVAEHFGNLKTGKSGFREADCTTPAQLTARLVTESPDQRKDKANVKIVVITMMLKPQTWGRARHTVAS